MELYLDYAASTPVAPEVRQEMDRVLRDAPGNPSSIHAAGRRARKTVEEAREKVAAAIGAAPREIVFTSGATEADNTAMTGLVAGEARTRLITSRLEHSAVLGTARALARTGLPVEYVEPGLNGEITPEAVSAHLEDPGALVALMLVNNETGIRTRIGEISELAHSRGALVFCDAVQAFGFEAIDVRELGADAVALSGHKAYGPKGVGALWLRDGITLSRLLHGGEQERGLRPGTVNTAGIAGMGVAAELASHRSKEHGLEIARLRDLFETLVTASDDVTVNGAVVARGPKHSSVSVDGVDGAALLMGLDAAGVCVSAGSACAAGSIEPSHVLVAMGIPVRQARATMRFSFGAGVTEEMTRRAADTLLEVAERCRSLAV